MIDNLRCPLPIAVCSLVALLLASSTGCGNVSSEYGRSNGVSGRTSLNGFGALRRSYETAGFKSRNVRRLSDRVSRVDTIVWTPTILRSINPKVTNWYERWLACGKRTLVYVIPDSGSEADYWMNAGSSAPAKQRLEYRRRAARSINQRMTWRMNRLNIPTNGWFSIKPLVERQTVGKASGRWAADLKAESEAGHVNSSEFRIEPYDADKAAAAKLANPAAIAAAGPTGPGASWSIPTETTETETSVEFTALVSNQSGDPIVVQIRSEKWKDSKIIVIAGGSLLTNYSFTSDLGKKLADKLVAESMPVGDSDPTVGFLFSDWGQIPVSEESAGIPTASGMELLTVWPISLITIHAVMLGLVICLMLLPVFGRPKRIRSASLSHFGDHLDAVAALMNKSGGEAYAKSRISEYMKRMHGETTGPWVLPEPSPLATPISPIKTAQPAIAADPPTKDQSEAVVDPSLPSQSTQPLRQPSNESGPETTPKPLAENETDL